MRKMLLPDVNVWIALAFDTHIHHPSALNWFNGLSDEMCHFCRLTQQGFLRIANNAKVTSHVAVPVAAVWQMYDTIRVDPRVAFAGEPTGLEPAWRQFTRGQQYSPHLWNDAYLAAFAPAGGYEIVTFDRAFAQFTGIAVAVLP